MKFKSIALAVALISSFAQAQTIRHANVLTVSQTHDTVVVGHTQRNICHQEQRPMYGYVPVYGHHHYHGGYVQREIPWLRALAGAAIGAHIGGSGDARIAGALIGGSIGHATSGYYPGPHIVGQSYQVIGYQSYPVCRTEIHPINSLIPRYTVIYELDGRQYTMSLPHHPGPTVQVVTSP